jgi:hypothetical protein
MLWKGLARLQRGRVRYQLRRSGGPGSAEALTLEPTELLRRLAATLPIAVTSRSERPMRLSGSVFAMRGDYARARTVVIPSSLRARRPRSC